MVLATAASDLKAIQPLLIRSGPLQAVVLDRRASSNDARVLEALSPAAGFLGLQELILPPVTSTVPPISAASGVDPAALERAARPNSLGRYGQFGGQYVPETLIPALAELEQAAAEAWKDPAFTDRLNHLLRTYVGRPNPLYEAERLTKHYRRPEGGPASG